MDIEETGQAVTAIADLVKTLAETTTETISTIQQAQETVKPSNPPAGAPIDSRTAAEGPHNEEGWNAKQALALYIRGTGGTGRRTA